MIDHFADRGSAHATCSDRIFPFEQTNEALACSETDRAKRKGVIAAKG